MGLIFTVGGFLALGYLIGALFAMLRFATGRLWKWAVRLARVYLTGGLF